MKMPFKKTGQIFIYALILGNMPFIGCRTGGLHQKYSEHFQPYTTVNQYASRIYANRTAIYNLENKIEKAKKEASLLRGLKYVSSDDYFPDAKQFKNFSTIFKDFSTITQLLKRDNELESEKKQLENRYSETRHIETALRNKAKTILKQNDSLSLVFNIYTGEQRRKTNSLISKNEHDLDKIRRTISFSGNDYMKTYDDYEDIFSRFYVGYEYVSANHLFEKGYPLLGMGLFARMVEDKKPDGYYGWDFYGIHSGLSAQLTSLDEQDAKFTNNTSVKLGESRSLSFEVPVFIPLYRSDTVNGGKHWFYIGPTGSLRGIKTDDEDRFDLSYYGGLRLAGNPETYGDILVGRSEGLKSSRFDMRFQIPLPLPKESTGENTSFYLGGAINLGMGESRKTEADFFKAYVIWNVDVWNILTKQTSSSK